MDNTIPKYTEYPALSFVNIKGFGAKPIPVQVSLDQRFLIISTYYKLTPVNAIPELIESYLGTQADLISLNRGVFISLLEFISLEAQQEDTRILDNDPLLLIRAFSQLKANHDLNDQSLSLESVDYEKALNAAIAEDDLIKNMHFNMVKQLQKTVS